ncbi:MAG: hypothetical protein ACLUD2_06890 [Clostridium sp.]
METTAKSSAVSVPKQVPLAVIYTFRYEEKLMFAEDPLVFLSQTGCVPPIQHLPVFSLKSYPCLFSSFTFCSHLHSAFKEIRLSEVSDFSTNLSARLPAGVITGTPGATLSPIR